jgi:hypothetical protein
MNQGAFESFYFGTPIVTRVYSELCWLRRVLFEMSHHYSPRFELFLRFSAL